MPKIGDNRWQINKSGYVIKGSKSCEKVCKSSEKWSNSVENNMVKSAQYVFNKPQICDKRYTIKGAYTYTYP